MVLLRAWRQGSRPGRAGEGEGEGEGAGGADAGAPPLDVSVFGANSFFIWSMGGGSTGNGDNSLVCTFFFFSFTIYSRDIKII